MNIKKSISDCVLFADLCDSLYQRSYKKDIIIKKYVDKLKRIDSISDYPLFEKNIKVFLDKKFDYFTYSGKYQMMTYYGYYGEILKYAQCKLKYPVITGIEHGIRFGNDKWLYSDYNTCYICQGENRIDEIYNVNKKMPVLPIGPYVHYSSQYYSDDKIDKIKKKNGKTLLVFLGHTTEWEKEKDSNDIFNIVYSKYAKSFQTVIVCVYWKDIDNAQIDLFKEKGAIVVSAGFRQDPNFIRRLKTIISLSDFVVSNDIGTNIGFAIYLHKDFSLEGEPRLNGSDNYYNNNYKRFYEAFHLQNENGFTKYQIALQKKLYEEFWGEKNIKEPNEMKEYFMLFNKLLKKSYYNPLKMHELIENDDKLRRILKDKELQRLKKIIKQ